MQVTFKNVGHNKLTWVAEMRPPTEQKMINAIRHRGAVLSVNISIVQDINNNQKFAICAGLPGTVAGVRVVGSIYLGNALAVEQAREQSAESAQPLYPSKIQTQDDTENDRPLRAFSSSSTAQPQPEQVKLEQQLDRVDDMIIRWLDIL